MKHVSAKSANELYLLRGQLPEFGTIKKPELIVKDYNYYKDNTFHWNRPSHSSKKMYEYYHKVNDDNVGRIEYMKEQQLLDQKKIHEIRKEEVIRNKSQDLTRHSNRKAERKVLQFESCQKLDVNDNDLYDTLMNPEVTSRVHSRKMNARIFVDPRPDKTNTWNNFTKKSEKIVNIVCTEKVIQYDGEGAQRILKRFEKQDHVEDIKDKCFQENREEIRKKFIQKHNDNYDFQRSLKLIPEFKNPESNSATGSIKNFGNISDGIDYNEEFRPMTTGCNFKQKYMVTSSFLKEKPYNHRMDVLSQPKNKKFKLYNPLDHSDFKGMLVSEIDERKAECKDNNLVSKLTSQSRILNENLETIRRSRPGTKNSRPKTSLSLLSFKTYSSGPKPLVNSSDREVLSKFNQENEVEFSNREGVLEEIDQFDKRFVHGKERKVGYPKIALYSCIRDGQTVAEDIRQLEGSRRNSFSNEGIRKDFQGLIAGQRNN